MKSNEDYFSFYRKLLKLFFYIKNFKKIYILILLLLLVSSAFFEISILGFLYILIKAFMNQDYYSGQFIFQFLIKLFNLTSNKQLILLLSFCFIIVCFLSGFSRLFFSYFSSKFVNHFGKNVANLCYEKLIYQEYKFYFSNNTSNILSIFSAKLSFINNSISNTLLMLYSVITFFLIFFILAYVNFYVTFFSTLFFVILYISITFFFKNKIMQNGSIVANEQTTIVRNIRNTFNGFRDILINNNQNFYKNNFVNSNNKLLVALDENRFIYAAPRPIIETFLLISIGFVIIFSADNSSSLVKLLPLLSILAIAAQRILPILNQIYTAHTNNLDNIHILNDVLSFLNKDIVLPENKKTKPLNFKNSITIKNVSFKYNSKNNFILRNINLKILAGSRVGIIGNSGSGKSTFIDLVLGLINPTDGEILVDGKPIINKKQSWFRKVSSVPQNIFITEQSFAENIAFGIEKNRIDLKKVRLVSKYAQISNFIEEKPNGYNHLIGEKGLKISVGQRQRIAIARALYKKSSLIIFDEATSALDSEVENKILDFIFKLDKKKYTVIIISHKLTNLKKCDRVYRIKNSVLTEV